MIDLIFEKHLNANTSGIASKIFIIAIFGLFVAIGVMRAQTISMQFPPVTPVSPEAADVQRYASYPVDYSTGIPNISIPLYEIKAGDIVLPITLSYHSAGLKPKEPSGRVGTGWTLNAEPSVMRSIRGLPDGSLSIYHSPSKEETLKLINGELDGESDLYSYMLNPGSGTCYRGVNSQFISYPRNNDKMELRGDSVTVTTGNGLVYHFGKGNNTKETISFTKYNNQTSRWLCNNITSFKTDANIAFSYIDAFPYEPNIYYNMQDSKIIEAESDITCNNTVSDFIYGPCTKYCFGANGQQGSTVYFNNPNGGMYPEKITRSALDVISFNGHKAKLRYDYEHRGIKYLTKISISDADNNEIRSINFYITPFNNNTFLTKLDSIRIYAPNCQVRTYRFKYYESALVPNIDTQGIDHWGFYNGKNNNGGVPTIYTELKFTNDGHNFYTQKKTFEGADREPQAEYAKYGVLKEICHPEGAITNFEYEGNAGAFLMYYRGNNYDEKAYYAHPVGGLRIATITESMTKYINPVCIKTYKYGLKYDNYTPIMGGGVIKHIVTDRDYLFETYKTWYPTSQSTYTLPSDAQYVRTWHGMPISNITFNNGSAVIYSFVQENIEDKKTGVQTTSKYYYYAPPHSYVYIFSYDNQYEPTKIVTGFWDLVELQTADPNLRIIRKDVNCPYDKYEKTFSTTSDINSKNDQEIGHLTRVEHYKQDTLVASIDYNYGMHYFRDMEFITFYKPYWLVLYCNTNDPLYEEHKKQYNKYAYGGGWNLDDKRWKALDRETHKQYFYRNGNKETVEMVKNYAYNNNAHTNPTDVVGVNYNQTITDQYDYHSEMVNTLSYHKRTVNNDSVVSEIVFANYRPQKVRYKAGNTNVFDDKAIYNRYDHYGNIAEVSTNDGKHTCYVWSYNNQHPIAEIDNITYSDLLSALGKEETWIKELGNKYQPSEQDMNLLNNLRNLLSASHVSTFTYIPLLGVSSITNASGFTTYYDRDNLGRLTETYFVENGNKKVIRENEYNIDGAIKIGNYSSFSITGCNITRLNPNTTFSQSGSLTILQGGADYLFEVYIEGGSEQFEYEWKLFRGPRSASDTPIWNTVTSTNKATIKPVHFAEDGAKINSIEIKVTDKMTTECNRYVTWFYVSNNYIK